jgi:hypothetical protein
VGEQREDERIEVRFLVGSGDPEELLARRAAEEAAEADQYDDEVEFVQPKTPGRYTLAASRKPPERDAEARADDDSAKAED